MSARIVAWNIRAGGGVRAGRIGEQIARWGADIAVLQEFRCTPPSRALAETLASNGLVHQETTAGSAAAANCLLVASRWPLRRIAARSAPSERGRWLLVRVDAPRGLVVGAMHVPNRVSGRKPPFLNAVHQLARAWRHGPGLLVGDTNSGRIGLDEEAPAFDKLEDGWIRALAEAGWQDAFRRLHGERRAYTWYSPNGGNGFRLDQAYINVALLPWLVDALYEWGGEGGAGRRDALSDHAALIVDLA